MTPEISRAAASPSSTPGRCRKARGCQLGGFAEHDPAAAAWHGECRQRGLRPNPDLSGASRAAQRLYAVGVHSRTGAPIPQIAAARAKRVRALDPDIVRVEREGITAFDALPLEGLQEELRHRGIAVVETGRATP